MQFQADILGVEIERPRTREITALGAACLAGLAVGFWGSKEDIAGNRMIDCTFFPSMEAGKRRELYEGWKRAVQAAMAYKSNHIR